MKSGGKAVVWLLAGFAMACEGATPANNSASSSDGPYRAIVDRNVFDLRPVPPQTAPPSPVTPPPNVKFIGVMRITDRVQGVFSVQDPTPGKQPVSYILSEDQREGTLEIKSINMAAKPPTARVQIGSDFAELKLDEPKAPTGPAPAPAAGLAAGPGQRAFAPGGRRPGFPMPGQPGQPGQPAPAGGAPSPSYSPGVTDGGNGGLPTRPVRTDAAAQTLSPEQQIINLEQTREQYLQNNDPRAAILPPSPITAAMQPTQNGENQPGGGASGTGASTTPTGNQLPAWLRPKATGSAALPMPGQ